MNLANLCLALAQYGGDSGPGSNWVNVAVFILVGLLIIAGVAVAILMLTSAKLWLQAYMSKAGVRMVEIIGMKLRRVSPGLIVNSKIAASRAGLPVTNAELESHYLAGGNVSKVVRALIAADRAGIDLDFKRAAAIDLAGRDVLDAVRTSVSPKVIDCPNPVSGRTTIDAVAKDGIQLKAKARVTVRTNIKQLVGGATEDTIIARVGEGIVTTIGSAVTHKAVLENPDLISRTVLAKKLDSGTAYEILSIDIADVDVGDNIGAKLQADQAEADKKVAQAKAEERRAMATAREQEMKATVVENRAKVVLAEAEIPKSIAQAFRDGNLGIMDYYQLKNIQADTRMRDAIGGPGGEPGTGKA